MFHSISNKHITRIHAYALLSHGTATTQALNDATVDTIALMLPLESLPAAALDHREPDSSHDASVDSIEITLKSGVAHWLGADHKHHQIGEAHKPLDFNIVQRIESDAGLLAAFVETPSGRPKYWAILKKHSTH